MAVETCYNYDNPVSYIMSFIGRLASCVVLYVFIPNCKCVLCNLLIVILSPYKYRFCFPHNFYTEKLNILLTCALLRCEWFHNDRLANWSCNCNGVSNRSTSYSWWQYICQLPLVCHSSPGVLSSFHFSIGTLLIYQSYS